MGLPTLYRKIVPLLVLQLFYIWPGQVNCVSQWDPFCKEDTLYTPYVRIFQKGRGGALLRDRGPGFIDVNGLQDIYVCTNGLVMLYYAKTRGNGDILKGEIYEHGELHWAPHHCELYNPSCTALGIDQPKKTLLSILLIGHPQDYRRPALQMFVAPTYDQVYKNYVNLTSLIMIGADGECLLEKGIERARLRVRINDPNPVTKADPQPEETPPYFCQLDSQRKLGQNGVINLNKPGMMFTDYPPDFNFFDGNNDPVKQSKTETGSLIKNRFRATTVQDVKIKYDEKVGFARTADLVYSALINDRPIRFVGCLQYPDFSSEQEEILKNKTIMINGDPAATPIVQPDFDKTRPDTATITEPEFKFWDTDVVPPWSPPVDAATGAPTPPEKRFAMYVTSWPSPEKTYPEALKKVTDAIEEVKKAKETSPPDAVTIKTKEDDLTKEKMMFSLWPLKQRYHVFHTHAKSLETKLQTEMPKLEAEHFKYTTHVADNVTTWGPKDLADTRLQVLKNISETRFDKRFDPYNADLVTEYNNYVNLSKIYGDHLRKESNTLGPLISDIETSIAQFRLYKELARRALVDLENAIRKMEKLKQPGEEVVNTGDPFDSYYVDTTIDISNAHTIDGTALSTEPGAKACYALPAPIGTCRGIKPETSRACSLCKNRKKQGIDWIPEIEWKEKVLELIESIHRRICPYISDEFAISVDRILKGYLMASPAGTGLSTPINGSRMYKVDHNYQGIVYNSTYMQMGNLTMLDPAKPFTLPPREAFWDQIIESLEDCLGRAKPMDIFHDEDGDRSTILLKVIFPGNKSETFLNVEDMFMQEKADYEYSFNWAIDMNWRIFATVLGYCMPHYETSIPLISAQFYAMYSKHFLHPLRQIWMSNRDNPVLKTILGSFYGTGKGERWGKICMESSFIVSGDRTYRPPRYLYVNAFTEMNYFTTGPLTGTSGRLVDAVI